MTTGNTITATRCGPCGRMSVAQGVCGACGIRITAPARELLWTEDAPITRQVQAPAVFHPAQVSVPRQTSPPALRQSSSMGETRGRWQIGDRTSGRVIIVRQAPHEPMDFDIWRWVAIPVWGLLLLSAPIAIAIMVWQSFGFLPALGVAGLSLIVFRFIFSDRLLQSWHLTAALNGRHIVEPMPVLMARLRHADGREIQLRLKGHLRGGTLMEGDRVSVRGAWKRGAFQVSSLSCERTGASIEPIQPNARTLAAIGSALLLFECAWLGFVGVPWVTAKYDRMKRDIESAIPTEVAPYRFPETPNQYFKP